MPCSSWRNASSNRWSNDSIQTGLCPATPTLFAQLHYLGNTTVQQEYSSINYSEVAGELIRLGVNVLAQLVAVSAEDVKKFIESAKNRYAKDAARGDMAASDSEECKGRRMDSHRSEDNVSTITYLDLNCDAESDAYLTTPDTSSEAEKNFCGQ